MTRALIATVLVALAAAGLPDLSSGQVTIRGVVRSESGDALTAAHVVVEGTSIGTITNNTGEFTIDVAELPVVLEIRHLGYRTGRTRVESYSDRAIQVTLEPSVYSLDEIIVADRDFAENVVRKVIQRKQEWASAMKRYQADGYTRITLENEDQVVAVHEAAFHLFGSRWSSSRAIVRSIRETSSIHEELGLLPAGMPTANFYADTVAIRGLDFVAPTHPDALDYYTYSFARTRSIDDRIVYDLYVSPRTERHASFIGVISILADEHVMIAAQLRPARFVVFPLPTVSWDVFYHQQFFGVEGAWLPADVRLEGAFTVRATNQTFGPVGLRQTTLFTTYAFDQPLPPQLATNEEVVILDDESIERDYLFALGINVVPLTPREMAAVILLQRSGMTLQQAYPPRQPLLAARMIRPSFPLPEAPQFDWPRVAGMQPSAGLNRVDGYRTGIGTTWRLLDDLYFEWRLTQAFALDRVRYHAAATHLLSERFWVSAHYTVDSAPAMSRHLYPRSITSLAMQLGAPDYYDYYWSKDFEISAGWMANYGRLRLDVRSERIEPLSADLTRAWPFTKKLDANPMLDTSRVSTVSLTGTVGQRPIPFRNGARNGITIYVEQAVGRTDPDSDFTLLRVDADAYLPTFYRARLRSNALHIRFSASTHRGLVPRPRYGAIQTSLRGFGTLGVLRGLPESPRLAPTFAGLFWEHDFGGAPFEWIGLSGVSAAGVGVRLTGAHARTWVPNSDVLEQITDVHHELGFSITNPLHLQVRLDVTYRLDDGHMFFGFGLGRF
jgi:hypothetical protein